MIFKVTSIALAQFDKINFAKWIQLFMSLILLHFCINVNITHKYLQYLVVRHYRNQIMAYQYYEISNLEVIYFDLIP